MVEAVLPKRSHAGPAPAADAPAAQGDCSSLSCIGVKPEFSYDPKILLFERVLLHRKDAKVVLLINNCFLPLKWMFIGAMTFDPDIVIQPPCGIIEPLTVKKVYFEYFSSYVQNVQKSITLEVYDTTGLQELLYSGELQVKIDSYDVLIDIMFNNSGDKFINFDRIKIEQTVSKTFSIKNKGNYSTSFSIKLEKVPGITFDPNEIFKVTPLTGNLGPSGKSVTVQKNNIDHILET
ncbi:hydrocephalus-inducing protein homolog [Lycorma delicatula]|uniref:hydrocephalus-inducing protein homolog n=1 Tax=Lycorma delicatula TaxID=130591 RepID=UPI003F51A02D